MKENTWNAEHYDSKLGYVSDFGKDVVSLLQPTEGEQILDLGCGTGDLTNEIASAGATVQGIDLSNSMIQQARRKYPDLQFKVGNAEEFHMDQQFNAVFSNAALHWMKHPAKVARCVWEALLPGGRFVVEFGGKGNIATVISALKVALKEVSINAPDRDPWYFPSIGEYTLLLEQQGFDTKYALHFDRPTEMPDGDKGLEHWLNGFAGSYLAGLKEQTRTAVIERVIEISRPILYRNGKWYIDYKRLRVVAVKNPEATVSEFEAG